MSDRYRKKPVEIRAIHWTGGDTTDLDRFCGRNWTRADAVDLSFEDDEQVVVWNTLERQWLNVPVGHWLICGIDGELYPCEPSVFERTYEPMEAQR
jgi:hypothetical protein